MLKECGSWSSKKRRLLSEAAPHVSDPLVEHEAQRQRHRRQLETLLAQGVMGPDFVDRRTCACVALRAFGHQYKSLPSTLLGLACQTLLLTKAGLVAALNAPDVLTQDLRDAGRYSAPTAYVFRALYTRPDGLSRSDLLTLCRPAIGGTADLDVALLPLVQTRIVRATRREGKTRGGVRWYQVVRV